jgi:hypothetical protein
MEPTSEAGKLLDATRPRDLKLERQHSVVKDACRRVIRTLEAIAFGPSRRQGIILRTIVALSSSSQGGNSIPLRARVHECQSPFAREPF